MFWFNATAGNITWLFKIYFEILSGPGYTQVISSYVTGCYIRFYDGISSGNCKYQGFIVGSISGVLSVGAGGVPVVRVPCHTFNEADNFARSFDETGGWVGNLPSTSRWQEFKEINAINNNIPGTK